MKGNKFDYEDRLVKFAGESIYFCKTLPKNNIGRYYFDQILRAAGSSALHYGEAQGTNTIKDFVYKVSNVVKELKETRVAFKVLAHVNLGDLELRKKLINEVEELIAIAVKMIMNKRK